MVPLFVLCLAVPSPVAAFAFCALHPLNPLCCPSPCPIIDAGKLADLAEGTGQVRLAADRCRAMVQTSAEIALSFGPNGPMMQELRRPPGNVSGLAPALPAAAGLTGPGVLAEPRALSEMLKQGLFDPDGLAEPQVTARLDKVRRRIELATDQAVDALSSSLAATTGLGDLARDGAAGANHAAAAADLRGDLAANGYARQALLDAAAGLTRLTGQWASSQALAAAETHPATLTALPTAAAPAADGLGGLARLRQVRLTVSQMDGTMTALSALHNERYAANLIRAQLPGLQKTIDSHGLAERFRAEDAALSGRLLGRMFVDGDAAFAVAAAQLRQLDQTSWSDGGAKVQAASDAAQTVIRALAVDPAAFGLALAADSGEGGSSVAAVAGDLANAFAAWLEDDKLEAFWRPAGDTARQTIDRLNGHLADLSRRHGFDILGDGAVAEEQALLDRLQGNVGQLAVFDGRDFSGEQVATIRAFVAAYQKSSAAVVADPQAQQAVGMVLPR
ncbi:MAG TPA: hypothetical protein HPQ04_10930 [Rhodospirillaceae bacterium]|nr:hypothetical protein [Rhodospirillaceae bacterium]